MKEQSKENKEKDKTIGGKKLKEIYQQYLKEIYQQYLKERIVE